MQSERFWTCLIEAEDCRQRAMDRAESDTLLDVDHRYIDEQLTRAMHCLDKAADENFKARLSLPSQLALCTGQGGDA